MRKRITRRKAEKKGKMIYLALFFVTLAVLIALFDIYVQKGAVIDERIIDASLIVSDTPGFDVNNTALTFGAIPKDSSSTRNILIANNYNLPIIAEISAEGEIERFLSFEKTRKINVNETGKIGITAYTDNEEYGKYEGKVIVVLKKAV